MCVNVHSRSFFNFAEKNLKLRQDRVDTAHIETSSHAFVADIRPARRDVTLLNHAGCGRSSSRRRRRRRRRVELMPRHKRLPHARAVYSHVCPCLWSPALAVGCAVAYVVAVLRRQRLEHADHFSTVGRPKAFCGWGEAFVCDRGVCADDGLLLPCIIL